MNENISDQVEVGNRGNKGKGGLIFFFILIYLLSAGVLAYGAYQYGLYKGGTSDSSRSAQDKQLSVNSDQLVVIPTTDNGPQVTAVPTTDYGQQSTVTPRPIVTVKPKATPTVTPINSSLINYKYQLPNGWQVVQSADAGFEMGFNSNEYLSEVDSPGAVELFKKKPDGTRGTFMTIAKLSAYDGGSRHKFIFGTQPVTKGDTPEKYVEKEFTYEGKNCLFLENVVISMGPTVYGMCDAGGGKAFWVNTWEKEYLGIVRSLKKLR